MKHQPSYRLSELCERMEIPLAVSKVLLWYRSLATIKTKVYSQPAMFGKAKRAKQTTNFETKSHFYRAMISNQGNRYKNLTV